MPISPSNAERIRREILARLEKGPADFKDILACVSADRGQVHLALTELSRQGRVELEASYQWRLKSPEGLDMGFDE